MTAALAPARAATTSSLPRWVRLAGWYVLGHCYLLGPALVIGLVLLAVVLGILDARGVDIRSSGMQVLLQVAVWLPFGVAIHYAVNWLGPQLAAGLTRRSFVKASVASAFGIALVAALAQLLLLNLEAWVYQARGWTADGFDGVALAPEATSLTALFGLTLMITAAALSGTLVGLSFVRLRAWATLLLPATVGPLLAVFGLALDPATMFVPIQFGGGDAGRWSPENIGLGGWAGGVLGLAVVASMIVAIHLTARRMPIRGVRA